jgi:hypothetical protein
VRRASKGGRRERVATQLGKPRLYFGISKPSVDLIVELLHNLSRRGVWCADAKPITRLIARHELSHGLDVGQQF